MRLWLPGLSFSRLASVAIAGVAGAFALASPGAALADNTHGPKIDDQVAAAAALTSAATPIRVIVFGNDSAKQDPSLTDQLDLGIGTAGTVAAGQLDAIAADPNVAYVAPDVAMAPLARPADRSGAAAPDLKALYALVDDAPAAWSAGFSGSGVGIAVIDSGVDRGALDRRLVARTGMRQGQDTYGHGSLVASFAAGNVDGQYLGVAPQANVIDVAVGNLDGSVYTSDVIAGLMWTLANKDLYNIRVVNLSLTETTPSSYTSNALDSVVELLWRSGIVVVTAAGNSGPGSELFAPANDPFAIAVGATDSNGTADTSDDTVTPWSSRGVTLDGVAKPDLVAPGRLVTGYLPQGTVLAHQAPAQNWVDSNIVAISGTSFAAPQVAGAVADLLQAHPDWTPDQVKAVLEGSARAQAGSSAPALDVRAAIAVRGNPAFANAGIAYAVFGSSDWVSTMVATHGQATWTTPATQATWAHGQATWTGPAGQATWTHGQATWTGPAGQATWTGPSGQATWTRGQATWTGNGQATWSGMNAQATWTYSSWG
jgi:serine protease AprX